MDKIALITGCNRGIGKATMELFIQNGISVIACTRILSDSLTVYYKSLEEKYNVKIYPIKCDLSDEDSIKTAMKEVYALKIPIDILVNNAGIAKFSSLLMTRLEEVRKMFQVNYFASLLVTQYIVKLMSRRKAGAIVNLASIAGIDSTVGNCGYGASKAAMILSTKVLARELSVYNIRVNAVAPGFIDTDMTKILSDDQKKKILSQIPLNKFGNVEDIANVALFLGSENSNYITGQVIHVDGGMAM